MDINFENIIKTILKDFPVDEETTNILLYTFRLSMLKVYLELIVAANENDQPNTDRIIKFILDEYASLPDQTKIKTNTIIADESIKTIAKIMMNFAKNLPPDLQQKLHDSLDQQLQQGKS